MRKATPKAAAASPSNLLPDSIPVPRNIQRLIYSPGSPMEWNVADADMLLLVREGRGEFHRNESKRLLHEGMVCLCPAGLGFFLLNAGESPLVVDRITYFRLDRAESMADGTLYAAAADSEDADGRTEMIVSASRRALQLSNALLESSLASSTAAPASVLPLFQELLSIVLKPLPVDKVEQNRWLTEQAARHIRDNYAFPLSRDQLASRAGVSPEHFSRLFRKETGTSFIDYVNRVRLLRAMEMLQLSHATIADVAKQSGFKSEFYFSRLFKRQFGIAPSVFRVQDKRYVSLMSHATSCLLTFGVVPAYGVIEPWMLEHFRQTMRLDGFEPIQLAEEGKRQFVREISPDLVFVYVPPGEVEELRDEAPVYVVQDDDADWSTPLLLLAEAAGRRPEAERWMGSFHGQAAAARDVLSSLRMQGKTAVILKLVSDKLYVYGRSTSMGGCLLYDLLGLAPTEGVQRRLLDKHIPNKRISIDALADYAVADHVFLFHYESQWEGGGAGRSKAVDVRRQLEKLGAGHIHMPNPDLFYGYDCLSLELQLQEAISILSSYSDM